MIFPSSIQPGLYAITSDAICADENRLLRAVEAALRGGAVLIQYRDKQATAAVRRERATRLLALCRRHRVPLVINDDAELAGTLGADGVHLGARDGSVAEARRRLGPQAIIGATCGDSLARARAAADAGASYVGFGRFFESRTKPEAPPCALERLAQARDALRIPVCAIGGLTPDNAHRVITAGASLVAAVGGVFDAPDIEAAARAYTKLFQ